MIFIDSKHNNRSLDINKYMTVDKTKVITIPVWLVSVIMPLIISLIIGYAGYTATVSVINTRLNKIEQVQSDIQKFKVNQSEFNIVLKNIERLENKIDKLYELQTEKSKK